MITEYAGHLLEIAYPFPKSWILLEDLIKYLSAIIAGAGVVYAFTKKGWGKLKEAYYFSGRKWKGLVFIINLASHVKQLQKDIPSLTQTVNRIEATLTRDSGKSFWDFIENGFNDLRKEIRQSNARIKVTEDIVEEVGIFFCDTSLRWLNVNEAITEWTSHPDSKLLGYGWKSVIHDNDLDFVIRHMEAAIHDNREDTFDFRLNRRVGYERFNMTVTPILDQKQNVFSLTGTLKKL